MALIGISGKIGSGKDTLTEMLQPQFPIPFETKMMAEALKKLVADILGIPLSLLSDQDFKKSNLPPEWNVFQHYTGQGDGKRPMTVRELLINIGDGMRERVHPDIWVNARFAQYKEGDNWIIPDVRYPNEKSRIEKLGGVVIRIDRPNIDRIEQTSETALDDADFSLRVDNDADLSSLYSKSKQIYNELNRREFFAKLVSAK